jgi:hypothetical protein
MCTPLSWQERLITRSIGRTAALAALIGQQATGSPGPASQPQRAQPASAAADRAPTSSRRAHSASLLGWPALFAASRKSLPDLSRACNKTWPDLRACLLPSPLPSFLPFPFLPSLRFRVMLQLRLPGRTGPSQGASCPRSNRGKILTTVAVSRIISSII